MDVSALQAQLRAFAVERDWPPFHSPKNLAMALMVEAAELLELFQWLTTAQSHTLTQDPYDKERVSDEIADVLLYLLQLADHTGVDLNAAVQSKLRKNAIKHPAKNAPPEVPATPAADSKVHLLVDWENVQPKGADLKALVPECTDVWLFHGPQQKVDMKHYAAEFELSRVTLVPSARAGKNALDFHLTYYIGYISARQQNATFVVVSNDAGYDPMLEHSRLLGFSARRQAFQRVVAVPIPVQTVAESMVPVKTKSQAAVKTPVKAPIKVAAASVAAKPSGVAEKATRQDVQALVEFLQQMKPSNRPAHREVLLAVIKAQLGAPSAYSLRVAHALSQLQAQQWVALKGNAVSYALSAKVAQGLTKAVPAKKTAVSKPAIKAVAAAAQPATPAIKKPAAKKKVVAVKAVKTVKPPTPAPQSPPTLAQMARKVIASLTKMPGNLPSRRPALRALIRSQIGAAPGDDVVANKVLSLLQAKGTVVEVGAALTYPLLETQLKAKSAMALR